jgi:5-(carboxyamino)imidazole ribonucleotide synthase
VLSIPGAHLHDYGKPPMPGRKVGHATLTGETEADIAATLGRLSGMM